MSDGYRIRGERVLNEIERASDYVREEFFDLLIHLVENPFPTDERVWLGILPFKPNDPDPRTFTAPFDAALLLYDLPQDAPTVILLVDWLTVD